MVCPQGIDLYHGTRCESLSPISASGLNASTQGRLGPGVYLTTLENATQIASHRGQGSGIIVLKCRVNLQSIKDMGTAGAPDKIKWPEPNYNSLTGMHLASAGIPHAW